MGYYIVHHAIGESLIYVIHLSTQGGDHAEHAVPENPESVIYFMLSSHNFLLF